MVKGIVQRRPYLGTKRVRRLALYMSSAYKRRPTAKAPIGFTK